MPNSNKYIFSHLWVLGLQVWLSLPHAKDLVVSNKWSLIRNYIYLQYVDAQLVIIRIEIMARVVLKLVLWSIKVMDHGFKAFVVKVDISPLLEQLKENKDNVIVELTMRDFDFIQCLSKRLEYVLLIHQEVAMNEAFSQAHTTLVT